MFLADSVGLANVSNIGGRLRLVASDVGGPDVLVTLVARQLPRDDMFKIERLSGLDLNAAKVAAPSVEVKQPFPFPN